MFYKKKAVLFDLDGVLCNTEKLHYQAWKEVSAKLGIEYNNRIHDSIRELGRRTSLNTILQEGDKSYTEEEKDVLIREKNARFQELLLGVTEQQITDLTRNTLESLRRQGYRLAAFSCGKNAEKVLENMGLSAFFDASADANDVSCCCPKPELLRAAAEKLGVGAEDCAVVADTKVGMDAAKKAGMTAFALFGDARRCGLEDYDLVSFGDLLNVL